MNKKLHILYLCSWFPNKYIPFLGNFIENHAFSVASGVQVSCLHVRASMESTSSKVEIQTKNAQNTFQLVIYYKNSSIPIVKAFRYWKAHRTGIRKIKQHYGEIDGVHLHVIKPAGIIALYLKWFEKLDFITTEHSTAYLKESAYKLSLLEKVLVKLVVNQTKLVSVVSNQLGESFRAFNSTKPFRLINNVVDERLFYPEMERKEIPYTFIHISTLIEAHKNPKGIINAFSNLVKKGYDSRLIIISDGEITPVKNYVESLNLENYIEFQGPKPAEQIANYLRKSDCLLLFSNFENMPVVISEAWMCGIPVISSDVGGIRDFLNNSNGILVKPRDEAGLEAAMYSLLTGLSSFSKLKISNEANSNFAYQSVGKKLISWYAEFFSK